MLPSALAVLSLAVFLGAILLMPRRPLLLRIPRRTAAVTHAALGTIGLAGFILGASTGPISQVSWLPIGLVAAGLIAGIMIFARCRHRLAPPVLILALHIFFAGMGYLLIAGLILS
jgi:hypothetical protein